MGTWIDADLATMGDAWICFVAEEDGAIVGQVEANSSGGFPSTDDSLDSRQGRIAAAALGCRYL
jgi:hypothetical protein